MFAVFLSFGFGGGGQDQVHEHRHSLHCKAGVLPNPDLTLTCAL